MAIDVPAPIGGREGNFRHEVALNRPERALNGSDDPPPARPLRNSSTVRVVPTAQVAQLALAVHMPTRPYWAAERGAGQNVHTTVPGSHHELADANSVGLF